ncbi:protein-glutamate O-methyltransferase CheR, partial [bacterium]|nr:protein-glutamate O-methyltransferase CheR [bacterium]
MTENEKIEIDLIIQAIYLKYGYDFRAYSKASIRRRVMHKFKMCEFKTLSDMQHAVLNDQSFFESLLGVMTINVTEMFRDPSFFKAIRDVVLPKTGQEKVLKIWNAGCSTGEEIYSLAILLQEKGLTDKTTIYATDIDENVIKKAKAGVFDVSKIK